MGISLVTISSYSCEFNLGGDATDNAFMTPMVRSQLKWFLVSYLGFRVLLEFLKPGVPVWGLTAIQWSCVAMLASYRRDVLRWLRSSTEPAHA